MNSTMSYLAPVVEVGGDGGHYFDFRGTNNGGVLKKIGVWAGEWQIRGVKIWLTNGQSQLFGMAEGSYSEFKFNPGERITSLSLWDNMKSDINKRLGAIKFETDHKHSFFAKMSGLALNQDHEIYVGSGICMGVTGRAHLDVDKLGFLFINPIQSTVLTNVSFPTLLEIHPHMTTSGSFCQPYENNTSTEQEYTFESTHRNTERSRWIVANGMASTFCLMVKAGIPEVVEVKGGYQFTVGTEGSFTLESYEEKDEKLSVPIKVPPGKKVVARVRNYSANVDLPYNGTITVTCTNRSVLEINTTGFYYGLTHPPSKVDLQLE